MTRAARLLAAAPILALAGLFGACQSTEPPYKAFGEACPVVAGGGGGGYTSYQEARDAFTRMSAGGVLLATLEDAAWIRFEGDPEGAVERHRAYFDYGQTTFDVVLAPFEFTRPTDETFILEDSSGVRMTNSPIRYEGAMELVNDRFQFTFSLSFKHVITKDLRWVRLTREMDGASVEWTLTGTDGPSGASRGS